jgi:serine protease Do
MNNQKTGKSAYITLGLGMVVGGLAVASLPHIVPSVNAQQDVVARPIAGISTENMAALRALDNSFASLAQYIEPSVVHIKSEGTRQTDMLGRRMGEVGGIGSGVIFRPDGWIITNDHVVNGFDKVTVTLEDGRVFPGTVRRAPENDIAVIKINADNLPAASFGDSSRVRPGQFSMAVGSPFDLDNTVTVGHISALGRDKVIPDERMASGARFYSDLIQTDAPINMGNSGGPLINVDGQVVGINSAIFSGTGGSVGIGFAIPSNEARMLAEMLINKGSVTKAYLGVQPLDLKEYQRKERNIDGAVASSLPNDGPAAMAGMKKDDVITRVGTIAVHNQQDVRDAMLHYTPGTVVPVEIVRGAEHKTLQVKLGDAKVEQQKQVNRAQTRQQGQQDPESMPFPNFPQDFGNIIPEGRGMPKDVQPLRSGKAKLGVVVETLTESLRSQFGIPAGVQGAVVTTVAPGSVAESIGIEPGFVIQQLGSKQIRSGQDLLDAMKDVNYGDTRQIKFGQFSKNSQIMHDEPVTFK